MTLDFHALGDIRCALGESPVYDDRRDALWFCDIVAHAVHRIELKTGATRRWSFPTDVGSLGLAESGRLLVALRHEVGLFDPDGETFQRIAEVEPDQPGNRCNDGKVGPDGAFWVGTMDDRDVPVKAPLGSLYRVDPSGKVERKAEGLVVANGLAFTADGRTMFHSDSRGKWIDRWDFDAAHGAIANRRRIATLDDATGRPDGGAADMEGYYWSAGVSAARLNRFSAEGKLVESFPVPVAAPTMPCFGGDDMKTLFVTSLRQGRAPDLLERYPLTGILMTAKGTVAGVKVTRFRDK